MSASSSAVKITPELVAGHGIKPDEYKAILDLIEREPTLTELGIFSAMWNEHCSYKSSRIWLKTLPTTGDCVVYGPGENAGVIDIGDGDVAVFKMESHNHPSFIEPYQGAGTGVGGILRDVFTMGARPVAALNALRFGDPSHPRTRHLVGGVVAGIGGYGNSFGVPTVGGEVNFHPRYNGNILVNAMAVGVAKREGIFTSEASGIGNPIVYLGSKTGRDGIHGATMASAEFDDASEDKRPTVQVGDPFAEKLLLEACLELMATDAVIAIQDMGAAGLTCSAVEMGAKGNLGIELNLEQVPCREAGMTPYEIMLSESQERMLMVLNPDRKDVAEAIFIKWGLDFAVIGQTTDTLRFVIKHNGDVYADLPIKELGDKAPLYNRPYEVQSLPESIEEQDIEVGISVEKALKAILGSPDGSSRRWIWEQYDHLVRGDTLQMPGGDAAVVRVCGGHKALAMSTDVTPRYVHAHPFEGGKQAVAECWRNITAVGAVPLAMTDNLNFGNPERPEIMAQFVESIKGIGDAGRALNFPIVSGNVSLYNETNGQGILPTPAIGGIGLLKDPSKMATVALKDDDELVFMIGETTGHIGQSLWLREVLNREDGLPPVTDLEVEKKNGDFVRSMIEQGLTRTVHDISDGGMLTAVAEMAMAGNKGVIMAVPFEMGITGEMSDLQRALFGEDQSRYLVAISVANAEKFLDEAEKADIYLQKVGDVGGKRLAVHRMVYQYNDEGEITDGYLDQKTTFLDVSVNHLKGIHEAWLPNYMKG